MIWTLQTAIPVMNEINRVGKKYGYLVCLYGSVLYNGESKHDLDIMIVPYTGVDRPKEFTNELSKVLSGEIQGPPYLGLMNTYGIEMKLPSGNFLDIQIRLLSDPPVNL